jgi:hypothetical protein
LAVFSALLPAAGALEAGVALEAAPPELVELDEPPQAAITNAAASPIGASHTLFIPYPPVPPLTWQAGYLTLDTQITKLPAGLFAGPGQVTGAIEGEPPAVSVGGRRLAGVARRRNPAQGVLGRPGGGEQAMGDSGYGYQFGTGIGEEELNCLEAQGAATAPATRMILAEVPGSA